MYNVTDNFIEQIGIAGKEKDTKIIVGENTIIPQSFKHSFSGNLFTSIMQKIEFEVKNGIVLTENTIIKPKYGLKVNGAFEYVNYSNYNVHTSEINYDTNIVKTVAYDNLIKFMIKWDVSKLNITFPTTILGLIQKICNYIGIQLYSTDFFNASLPIDADLFTALNCTYRDVIDYICQATLTVAIIKDNKLYLKNVTNTNKTINPKMLKKFKLKQQFGGCNSLVLGRGDLNDNIYSKDEVLIAADGLQEIRFDNNEILDKRREQVIDSMFAQIKGLKYYAFETKDLGIGIFEPADICNVQDLNSNTYKVLVLNQGLTITSGCEGAMSAEIPENSTTKYKYATDSQKRQSKTEIIVDKQNKKIEAVVSDVDEQSEKISKVTQTLYKLQSEISEIADVTNSISGNGSVELKNVNASEPIRIEIRPIGEDISYLYPSNTLYPADNLYLKNRKLRFENTNGYAIEWELPDDLLYYDSEHYDELILDYTGQSCVINKKVERNADGSKYLLTTPATVSYKYPTIPLEAGDYTITLLGYNTAYLFVRLMIQNIYTDQFATKVEMNSSITQTKEQIDLNVNKKLSNYSTTTQMNSAINLKADSITNSVSQTYSTKTETANAKTEAINSANTNTNNKLKDYSTTIQMNSKIAQKANSILNTVSSTYATKSGLNTVSASLELKINKEDLVSELNASADVINFKAGRLLITGGNFKLDSAGNITANGGTIGGFSLSSTEFSGALNGAYNYNVYDARLCLSISVGNISKTSLFYNLYDVDGDNKILATDALAIMKHAIGTTPITKNITGNIKINSKDPKNCISITKNGELVVSIGVGGINTNVVTTESIVCGYGLESTTSSFTGLILDGRGGKISCVSGGITGTTITSSEVKSKSFNNESLVELKKNITKLGSVLEIIKNSTVYEFNYKTEDDKDTKHTGFVIGENYKTPDNVISKSGTGIDLYNMCSIMWKAIQELLERV